MADVDIDAVHKFIHRMSDLKRNVEIGRRELALIDMHIVRGRKMVGINCDLEGDKTRNSMRISASINLGLIRAQVEIQLKRDEAALKRMLSGDAA